MKVTKWMILAAIGVFPILASAQYSWEGEYNRFGMRAGVNNFNIVTNDLPITAKTSWTAGFTTRSSYFNNFQWIYGINFYDFRTTISGREKLDMSSPTEEIPFNMIGVQANFFGSYKIIGHYLSIEAGPVVQVNGKLEPRQNNDLYYIEGYNFQAKDLEKIATFNFNFAIGISGGFEKVKFWTQYQLGINNILNGLNDEGLQNIDPNAPNFEGRMRMLTAGVILFL